MSKYTIEVNIGSLDAPDWKQINGLDEMPTEYRVYGCRIMNMRRRESEMPPPDLSMVADEDLVREYLRLLDILVHTKPIPPGVGASYDDHWNELERRGFTVRKAELERWLEEAEAS